MERPELLARLKTSNPFRVRLENRAEMTRVVRKVHRAEIVGFEPRKFTVVALDLAMVGVGVGVYKENAVRLSLSFPSSSECRTS